MLLTRAAGIANQSTRGARLPAEHALCAGQVAVAAATEHGAVFERTDLARYAEPAARPAGAAGPGYQAIFFDQERVFVFERLDRQVRGVGDMHLNAVLAVAVEPGASAAAQRLEIHIGAFVPAVPAGKHDRRQHIVARRHDLLRRPQTAKRTEDRAGDTLAGDAAGTDRGREARINDGDRKSTR